MNSQAAGVDSVRVDVVAGAPRLLVNGQPTRARMFWGAPAPGKLAIGPEARELSFEFSPRESEPGKATMHFRFGQMPGEVCIDEIRVQDLTTGKDVFPRSDFEGGPSSFTQAWNVWPTGPMNTVGEIAVTPGCGRNGSQGLRVALKAPPDGRWPDFHFYHHQNLSFDREHRYRVTLWAKAQPQRELTVAFYRPGANYVFLGGPPSPFENQIKLAADAEVKFVSFPIPLPWPEPGTAVDWSQVDVACQSVLEANPNALLLPRIGMGAPDWWYREHPDSVMVWDAPADEKHPVVASPDYRRDAAERLAALIAHLEAKFGRNIAGYHPCGQNTGEWFYQDTWKPTLSGYSQANQAAWRRWLSARYGNDAALRSAWRDPQASLETAAVPTPAVRRAAPAGLLRDPSNERVLLDYAEFQQEMMAECVCDFARAAREASKGRKLVVFFYGYVFEFGAIANGPAVSGHYALRRVLKSPDIDVLCSPISYFDRGLGESGPAMTAAESIALAGKMWLYEDDTATYLSSGRSPGWDDRVKTIEETNHLLLRNTAQCAVRNFGSWWMDLGATGWFNDSRMWAVMQSLKPIDEALLRHPRAFRPEVAAVIDEQSMLRLAAGGNAVGLPGVYEVRRPLGRLGAPYGQYLLDDVIAGRVKAKMYVFLTAWRLSAQQRQALLDATEGSVRVWCYAPGAHEEDRVSPEAMQMLTGFQLRAVAGVKAKATPTPLGVKLGMRDGFGPDRPIAPLFAALDAKPEEILATFADGSAAVALRSSGDGWSLFVGPPGPTSDLLRVAARRAGVHLFAQVDSNVYANGPYLVVHAAQDGPLALNVGQPGAVADALTGRTLGSGPQIVLPIKKGETRILAIPSRD